MNKLKLSSGILLLAAVLVLQGCWDRIEIQERGFVVGVGVDLRPLTEEEEEQRVGPRELIGTLQIINPSVIQGGRGGGQQSGGNAYINPSTSGHSLSSIAADLSSRIGRQPFFEHLRLLVVSAEAAQDPNAFSNAVDFFLRSPEMRRNITVLIAENKALDILSMPPVNENYPVAQLDNILDNNQKDSYLLPPKLLGDLHQDLLADRSYAIQTTKRREDTIALSGTAVFDGVNNTMQGVLNGPETQGLNFLMGTIKGGVLEALHEKYIVDLLIERASHTMSVDLSNPEKPVFVVTIEVEGALDQSAPGLETEDTPKLEATFEEKIATICAATLKKLQQEMKLDPAGFGQHLMRTHYRLWKREYEDKWDKEIFPAADIQVKPHVVIRRFGSTNESERRR